LQAVGLTPWVETHGYKMYRADGSLIETNHTKRYEALILTEQVVLPAKSTLITHTTHHRIIYVIYFR
jgi:hypothetical protein